MPGDKIRFGQGYVAADHVERGVSQDLLEAEHIAAVDQIAVGERVAERVRAAAGAHAGPPPESRDRTYAERMFRHLVIGHLERGDAWDALGIPLSGSDRSFELSLVGEIVERTAGYPYFLQFFGGFLCSRVGRPDVRLTDYLALESSLLHELDLAFFEDRYLVAGAAGPAGPRRDGPGRRTPLDPQPSPLSGRPPER